MDDWKGTLTKKQAIRLIDEVTAQDDPYWENVVENYYDEETDTMPSICHVFAALGVTEAEYRDATGVDGDINWPVTPNSAS